MMPGRWSDARRTVWLGHGRAWAVIVVICVASGGRPLDARQIQSAADVERWAHRAWDADDGLPDGVIRGVVPAPDGSLAIGTDAGLVRFDGRRMWPVALELPPGEKQQIQGLCSGEPDELIVLLRSGAVVALRAGRTRIVHHAAGDGAITGDAAPTIVRTPDGALWLGSGTGTVQCVRGGPARRLQAAFRTSLEGSAALATDLQGRVWIAGGGTLAVLERDAFSHVADLPEGRACIAPARDGGVWVVAGRTLTKRDGAAQLVHVAQLADSGVFCLHEDSAGRLWIGTSRNGLLCRYAETTVSVATTGRGIHSLFEERPGVLWAGTPTALNRITPSIAWLDDHASSTGPRASPPAPPGGRWFVTKRGELGRDRDGASTTVSLPAAFLEKPIRALVTSRSGDVWVAVGHALLRYDPDDATWHECDGLDPPGAVHVLAEDHAGRIWAGTLDGRVVTAERGGGAGEDDDWLVIDRTPDALPAGTPIGAICPAAGGSVWVSICDVGLLRFKEDRWVCAGPEQIPSIRILTAVMDHHERLWCVCGRRLMVLSLPDLEVAADRRTACHPWLIHGTDTGSFTDTIGGFVGAAIVEPDGRIRIASRRDDVVCDPAALPPSAVPPAVSVEEVRLDRRVVFGGAGTGGFGMPRRGELLLPPGPGLLELTLATQDSALPTNVAVEHRLDGIDSAWIKTAETGVAVYPRLPGGSYSFAVRSVNDAGTWMAEGRAAALAIRVQPRFWERTAVRLAGAAAVAAAAAALGLAYASHRSRTQVERLRRQAAVERERARIARDVHDDVGTSLTQIALLAELACGDTDPAVARARLQQVLEISHGTVAAIDELVWAVNPANDTLPRLVTYIGQCAVDTLGRFGVRCRVDAPDDLPPLTADAEFRRHVLLMAKEAIHNVVEHSRASEVHLAAQLSDARLRLTIADDGGGIAAGAIPRGAGLANMRRRADDLGGRCEIGPRPGGGTLVTFDIPVPHGQSLA